MKKIFQCDIAYVKLNNEQFDKLLNGKEFKGQKIDNFLIAHGESGNHHTITANKKGTVEVMDIGNGIFGIKINGRATITHEKHKPEKTLTKGLWFASRKTEYDPIGERMVSD